MPTIVTVLGILSDAEVRALTGRVIGAKGFDAADSVRRAALRDQALPILRAFRKREAVEQIADQGAWWDASWRTGLRLDYRLASRPPSAILGADQRGA
jgi:hypothetical protein